MSLMLKLGCERNIPVMPVYAVSEDPAATILDLAATIGVDFLMIGASHRTDPGKVCCGEVWSRTSQHNCPNPFVCLFMDEAHAGPRASGLGGADRA